MRYPVAVLIAFAVAACGSSSAPTVPVVPTYANIAGTWNLVFNNMAGGGVSCYTTTIAVTISQSSGSFTGSSQSAWTLTCTSGGASQSSPETGATISNGTINGNAIRFSLATNASTQVGTLNGNTISGTATWMLDEGTSVVTLSGQFSLTR